MAERTTHRRRVTFRVLAVSLSLLPFVGFEFGLRLAGVGEVREADVPAIGFQATYPLFELDEAGEHFKIAESRQAYFSPDSFAAQKSSNEFRIFCLGGSTVQGRPYSIETSFTTWLELSLNAADPSRKWDVVNCGGVSYASYRLVPILNELLAYEPDLLVIYTGHNEFLEARTFANLSPVSPLSQVRTFNLLRSAWSSESRLEGSGQPREILAAEVDALLDYRGGLADYHRDDAGHQVTVRQYADNLKQMIDLAHSANVPVALMNPASNLKDTPPFKIEPRSDLTVSEAAEFETLLQQSRAASGVDDRVELLEQAVTIDGRHSGARFLLGHAYLAQHRPAEAREQFIRAKDEDVCPLRMIEPLHDSLRRVAESSATPLIDVRHNFESRAADGIPGDSFFLDHIHPSINNHQVIAQLLVDQFVAAGFCHPQANWEAIRDERYRRHLATLDTPYYAKGKQRLEGLTRWTQGRANKLRDGTSLPPGLD
ncbi:MAG: SGNH/GDSL hydrolase family protein [Planctomycetota bacterium]|nr:SGNH/GDSL hydrolase family protein [Planctomycetota bacterium]